MTYKEHAKEQHSKSEVHHLHEAERERQLSKMHKRLAQHFAKTGDEEPSVCHEELSKIHEAGANMHSDRGEYHRGMATLVDAMEEGQPYHRSVADRDLEKLVPTQVRAIADPSLAPFGSAAGVIAVPRTGQPPINQKPHVPAEFEFLFETK